jgi:hypothetical protein
MFALDLHECTSTTEDGPFFPMLHPIVRFRPHLYHLKNGEGKPNNNIEDTSTATTFNLSQRIFNLIATKTQQQFQPTTKTHRIVLLTHLEYYGYNFNPVSFYYILSRTTGDLDAVVGEVSNTPWTEMYCYVLHPDSIDNVQQHQLDNGSYPNPRVDDPNTQFYRFPKTFHVSPFMEMEYWYDWTFQQTPLDTSFVVVNSLRRRTTSTNHDETKTQTTNIATKERLDFTARLELQTQPLTPYALAWQLIRFPIFCFVIQVWIHYQAAWLFLKGIVYVPHPQGSETAASKAIATLMIPFFAIRDRMESRKRSKIS